MSGESVLIILVVGLIAGWLAGQIVQGTRFGLVGDLPTPPAPAGAFFWAAVGGDRINRHHVIEPLLPAFAMLSGRNEIG